MRNESAKVCVVVTGMHRSGTSALSRFLTLLGCAAAKELTGANSSNETGHWEPEPIRAFNDRLLASFGSGWDDWQRFDLVASTSGLATWRAEAATIFASQFDHAALVVMKDPRVCRTFGFWKEVIKDCGYEPRVAAPVRNPLEVAASLNRRDGSDPVYGQLLWLSHVLDAEADTRGLPRRFVTYDALLEDWRSVARALSEDLSLTWPAAVDDAAPEIERYLDRKYRHQTEAALRAEEGHSAIDWVTEAFSIFSSWALSGECEADRARLDALRVALEEAQSRFGALIWRGHQAAVALKPSAETVATLKHLLHQTEAMLAEQAGKARDIDIRFTELWHTRDAERTAYAAALDDARAEVDRLTQALAQANAAKPN